MIGDLGIEFGNFIHLLFFQPVDGLLQPLAILQVTFDQTVLFGLIPLNGLPRFEFILPFDL